MLYDKRKGSGMNIIILNESEANQIFNELKHHSFHIPDINCTYLDAADMNTLHIYVMDGKVTFTVVTRSGRHSSVNMAHQVITVLSSKNMRLVCSDAALACMHAPLPHLHRYVTFLKKDFVKDAA